MAITRAYYAMFYAASALLASEGISRSKHSGVHAAFGERFVKSDLIEAEYVKMQGYAFDSRLDSDYDVEFVADQALAEDVRTFPLHPGLEPISLAQAPREADSPLPQH